MNQRNRILFAKFCAAFLALVGWSSTQAATVTWIGGSGDWNTSNNWSSGVLPGPGDSVVIGPGPAITITHSTGTHSVASIASQQSFNITGGSLSVAGNFIAAAPLTISAGVLNWTTVITTNGASLIGNGGTLNGVTVNGLLDVGNTLSGANLTVSNGLVLNGTALVGNPTNYYSYGKINFAGTQTLGGNASVMFGAGGIYYYNYYNALQVTGTGSTLTIGPGITVHGQNGSLGYDSNYGGTTNVQVINQGIISSDVASGLIEVSGQSFSNLGTAQAKNGGTFTINCRWNNPGTLAEINGTLNLGGSFSFTNIGTLNQINGNVFITGTLTNTGQTLNLSLLGGNWGLGNGGKILGGTVVANTGTSLPVTGNATLDGVTLNGTLDVGYSYYGAVLTITNGLTLNGTALLGNPGNYNYGTLSFAGTQTLGGNGTVAFGNNSSYNLFQVVYSGTTLTISTNILVHGQSGIIGYTGYYQSVTNIAVINQGTIAADTTNGSILINATPFRNQGLVQSLNGGSVTLNGNWNNLGALAENGGSINLGGAFSLTNVGTLRRTNGTISITGTLTNTGTTLVLNGTTGSWTMGSGGYILGGSVVAGGGAGLIIGGMATMDGVTMSGPLDVGNTSYQAVLTLTNGFLLNGTVSVGNPTNSYYGQINFAGSQTFSGNATVVFGGASYYNNLLQVITPGSTLTLGAGITLRGKNGTIGYSVYYSQTTNISLINLGTISADVAGGTITVSGQPFLNQGLAQGINGGTLIINGTWNNFGTLVESGGSINLGGNFALTNIGTLNVTNGTIFLSGTMTNTGQTFNLNNAAGSWVFNTGTVILGGTIVASNGTPLVIDGTVTFDGVTVDGAMDVGNTYSGASLTVTNGFVLNGTAQLGNPTNSNYGRIGFAGSQTFGGSATVQFGAQSAYYGSFNAVYPVNDNSTLTIGAGITMHGQRGAVGNGVYGNLTNVTVLNQGIISSDTQGGIITVAAVPFVNQGIVQAVNGGVINFSGSYNFAGGAQNIGIGGPANYGQFNFAGPISLTTFPLSVILTNSYVPLLGTSFPIVTYGSFTGVFGSLTLPSQTIFWQANYGSTTFSLIATNEIAPDVSIISPSSNSIFVGPTNITLTASATNSYAAIAKVDFFEQGYFIGEAVSAPYTVGWTNVPPGIYSVTAQATDVDGNATTSVPIVITVRPAVAGTNYVWVGYGDWFTPANWSPAGIPGAADSAFITNGGSPTPSQNVNIAFLTMSGYSSISGTNTLSVNNSFDWTGGSLYCPVVILSNAALNLAGAGTLDLYGPLTNAGTVNWSGPANLEIFNIPGYSSYNGSINNLTNAVFNAQSDQSLLSWYGGGEYFNNAGLYHKGPNAGTNLIQVAFTNSGLVQVDAGALGLQGPLRGSGGTIDLTLGGLTNFGSLVFSSTLAASNTGTLQTTLAGGYSPAAGDGFTLLKYASVTGTFSNLSLPGPTLWEMVSNSTSLSIIADGSQAATNTSYTWTGGTNTDWFNPTNWTPQGVPNGGTGQTINFTNGTINLTSNVAINGDFEWRGGTLSGSPITIGSTGVLDIDGSAAKQLNCSLTNGGTVVWTGGNILVSNCGASAATIVNLSNGVWAIWSDQNVTASCTNGTGDWENDGLLIKLDYTGTTSIGLPFHNAGGVLEADSGTISFTGLATLDGAVVEGPGAITFAGGLRNNLTLAIDYATVSFGGGWTNSGQIDATNSLLNLGGTFTTANMGVLSSIGGAVNLTGTLNNTGNTLSFGTDSSWFLSGGVINGGTLITSNAGALLAESSGNSLTGVILDGTLVAGSTGLTLNGVTINGTLDVGNSVSGATVLVTNGLTLNGTALIGNPINNWSGGIEFLGNQNFSGVATVIFGDGCNSLTPNSTSTLTIGPGIVIRGQNGYIGNGYCFWGTTATAILNQGTIACDVSGGTFNLWGRAFTNAGLVEGINGGSLSIDTLQNATNGTLVMNGGSLTLPAANNGPWTNGGTFDLTNTTLTLGGTFTFANLGVFNQSNINTIVTGTLINSNATLTINTASGPWTLTGGGTIRGGTIAASNGMPLIIDVNATLDGVTVNGALDVGSTYYAGILAVTNGLVLNGTALVGNPTNGNYGNINFAGSQTLGGNGTVIFGDETYSSSYFYNALQVVTAPSTLTIGPGITVRGQEGAIGYDNGNVGPQGITILNLGTISSDVTNGVISVYAQPFTNQGLAQAINGGTLLLNGAWYNSGTLAASNGSINLNGSFSWTNLGTLSQTNATVLIGGTLTNTGTNLTVTANAPWGLATGGKILGGTIEATNGTAFIVQGNATLDGVVLNGLLDVGRTYNLADLTVTNGLVLNGTASVGNPTNSNYGIIDFAGSQTLNGAGTVVFGDYNAYANNALRVNTGGATLTLGPQITVQGQNGAIGYSSSLGGPQNVTVINQGIISADIGGGTITVQGVSNINAGTLHATTLAALNWSGDLVFNGSSSLTTLPGASVGVGGNLLGAPSSPAEFNPGGTFSLSSGAHELEAMSLDVGNIPSGYVNNFGYGGVSLASGANVTLVDLSTNTTGGQPECVYVNSLNIAAGATLNLNGIHLYTRLAKLGGAITNGTIQQAPTGGGPLIPGSATPSVLTNAGALAVWTFFGQAGQHVAVVVDPGSASVLPPQLGYASIQLLDPSTNLVAQATNASGQVALINNAILPATGTYSVEVRAPASQSSSFGNYLITVWTLTASVQSLTINQQANGLITTPYSLDQWNFSAIAGQQITFDLLNVSAPGVAFSLAGPNGWTGFSNLVASSGLVTLPYSGNYSLTAFGTGGQYGINFAFRLDQTAQTNLALGTNFSGQLVGSHQAQLFTLQVTNTNPMRISLTLGSLGSQVQLYAKFGAPPTPGDFDYSYQGVASQMEDIVIPAPTIGTLYILIYGNFVPQVTSYTLEAIQNSLLLESYSPNLAGSGLSTVLIITGAGFNSGTIVQLTSTNGTTVPAQNVKVLSSTEITALFPSNSIPAGTYTVCATSGNDTECLSNLLTVISGGLPNFHASMTVPSVVGYHQPATIFVDYSNTGTAPMPAPLLLLSGTQSGKPGPILTADPTQQSNIAGIEATLLSNFNTGLTNAPPGFTTLVQILASGKIPGLLQPGEAVRVPVYYAGWLEPWDFNRPPLIFTLGTYTAQDTNMIDWAALGSEVRPGGIDDATWATDVTNLQNQLGSTWGSYVDALDVEATGLSQLGVQDLSLSNLFALELLRAEGLGAAAISGQVLNASNQLPVAGVVVHDLSSDFSSAANATTDPSGSFLLTGISDGIQNLTVDGYFVVSNDSVTISGGNTVTGIKVMVTEAGHLTGHVRSATNSHPLPDVLMFCASQTNALQTNVVTFHTSTDSNGFYNFTTLPTNTYTVSCAPANYAPSNITGIVVVLAQTVSNVDFNLAQGAVLSGTVRPQTGSNSVAGATLDLVSVVGTNLYTTTTGSNGSYQFPNIAPGAYNLEFILYGVTNQTITNITLGAGQVVTNENITVAGVTISGTVTTGISNAPVFGARMALLFNQTNNAAADMTDSNGLYTLEGVSNGTYTLLVQPDGYAAVVLTNIQVTGSALQVNVTVGAPSEIDGTVTISGQPGYGDFVFATIPGNSNLPPFSALCDTNGRFALTNISAGTYNVAVIDPYAGVETQTNGITVTNGQQINIGTISMTLSNGATRGTVTPLRLGGGRRRELQIIPPPLSLTAPGFSPPGHPTLPADAGGLLATAAGIESDVYLRTIWIPAAGAVYGNYTAAIWKWFLDSTQGNPTPIQDFKDGSQIVEGTFRSRGFRDSVTTKSNIHDIENLANQIYVSKFLPLAAADPNFSVEMPIEQAFPQFTNNPNDWIYAPSESYQWNFSSKFEIPGNIAGGTGLSDLYPDSRWVTGTALFKRVGTNLIVTYTPTLYVLDAFDFIPGDLGTGVEQLATRFFAFLEIYDLAYDVTFRVTCHLAPDIYTNPLPTKSTNYVPVPPCVNCTGTISQPVSSQDPNGKIGPAGIGHPNWVSEAMSFPYTIDFENATNASVPAQIVNITDPLSTNFDWTTFELAEIAFGTNNISVPLHSQTFATNVSITYSNVPLTVQIQAGIDLGTGIVTVNFNTINATNLLAPPVNIGFLPPEDGTGRGDGHVTYFIQPKAGLATGTQLTNIALITFDENPVIATDQVNDENAALGIDTNKMDLVTIDNTAPVTSVNVLPATEATSNFSVCWSGMDAGSGIFSFNIYVSTNNGPWKAWLLDTTNTCATFTGHYNTTYSFYSVAQDMVGNMEATPTNAEAITTTLGGIPIAAITGQPQSVTTNVGGTVAFSVTATGELPLFYQWSKNSNALAGATSSILTLTNVQLTDAGSYTVVVSNISGLTNSAAAVLTVTTNSAPTQLEVIISGKGTVTPDLNGKTLVIGHKYSMTAKPAVGYLFDNWTGSVATNTPALHFVMQPNMILEANFVSNIFLAAQGAYNGLFAPTNGARLQNNSGAFSLNVANSGSLSGKLTLGSETVPLSGKFGVTGAADLHTKPAGHNSVHTTLQLDVPNRAVTGTVGDGTFVAVLNGDQKTFSPAQKAAAFAGSYTMIIPGSTNPAIAPYGDTYGTVTVSTSGTITFAGSLADGTTVSQSSVVSKDGYWPFYVLLYNGKGSLWSWNLITNGTIISTSDASWIKPAGATAHGLYPSGFTNAAGLVDALTYSGNAQPLLNANNALVILQGGGLSSAITNQVTLTSKDTITATSAGDTNKLNLIINKKTGVISGTFANPAQPKKIIKVSGVLLQAQTNAAGYFLGTNESGLFILIPQ